MDWTFPKGVAYGAALGLLLAMLALNIAGEIWPGETILGCLSNPPGTGLQRTASF